MEYLLLFAISIAPGIFLIYRYYSKDIYKKEPWVVIWKSFFWGAATVLPAGLIETSIELPNKDQSASANLEMNFFVWRNPGKDRSLIQEGIAEFSFNVECCSLNVYSKPESIDNVFSDLEIESFQFQHHNCSFRRVPGLQKRSSLYLYTGVV
jgi:hypothetical protein